MPLRSETGNLTIPSPKKEYAVHYDKTVDAAGHEFICVNGDNGNLTFRTCDSDHVRFEISNKLRSVEDEATVYKRLETEFVNTIGTAKCVNYEFHHRDKSEKPFDAWTDVCIYVPRSFKSILITLDNGSVKIVDAMSCTLEIKGEMLNTVLNSFCGRILYRSDSGDLRINDGRLLPGTDISFDIGNINICGSFSPDGDSSIATGIGNIMLCLHGEDPVGFKCDGFVKKNDFAGSDYPSRVSLRSGMGNIIIAGD